MQEMITINYRGQQLLVTSAQAAKLQERMKREEPSRVRTHARNRVSDAAEDACRSTAAIARTVALVGAAGGVVVSDAVASGARIVADRCNKASVNLAKWILAR